MSKTRTIPVDLAEIIETHKALFGGFTMTAGTPETGNPPAEGEQQSDDFKSEHSKQSVLADLAKARLERQALQAQVNELTPFKDQFAKLQEVFAPKQSDDKAETADALTEITRRIEASELSAEVERLARTYKIDDDDTVALLKAVPDKTQREALAKRLAPTEDDKPKDNRRQPRPDPSVGKSGGDGSKTTSVDSGRSLYADMHKKPTT